MTQFDIQNPEELAVALDFDQKVRAFLKKFSIQDLAVLMGRPGSWVEEVVEKTAELSTSDLFTFIWNMELLMTEDAIEGIINVQNYLHQWFGEASEFTQLNDGILEEKDVEQLIAIHGFVDQELDRMIELLRVRQGG